MLCALCCAASDACEFHSAHFTLLSHFTCTLLPPRAYCAVDKKDLEEEPLSKRLQNASILCTWLQRKEMMQARKVGAASEWEGCVIMAVTGAAPLVKRAQFPAPTAFLGPCGSKPALGGPWLGARLGLASYQLRAGSG